MGIRHKKNKSWLVAVDYIGLSPCLDKRLCKTARVPCAHASSSHDIREMRFYYKKKENALAAAKRLRTLRTHSRISGNFLRARVYHAQS